jgi:lysine 6-dehydrogenase
VRLIEVRGTWPARNMQLIRALYDCSFLRNDKIQVGQQEYGIMEFIARYLLQSEEGQTTDIYGYALHVEIIGSLNGQKLRHILTHTPTRLQMDPCPNGRNCGPTPAALASPYRLEHS